VDKYVGTQVFLQVFDDCAHVFPLFKLCFDKKVTPALSFTKPAKYMYRSIANFGIWCTFSDTPSNRTPTMATKASTQSLKIKLTGTIPEFQQNMIRQRVSPDGIAREMESESEIAVLNIQANEICVIHSGPTKRWLTAKQAWDTKYSKQTRRVQLSRRKEYINAQNRGFLGGDLEGEMPPPSALAGRPSQMAIEEDTTQQKKRKNLAG
jgi:hypothetical protein